MNNLQNEPASTPKPQHSLSSRATYELLDWTEVLLSALVGLILVLTFLFRIVVVSGSSMSDTLQNNDYLVLSNLGSEPKTGDIVVLQVNSYADGTRPLIKRVIATGGQWVDIDFDTWQVSVGDSPDTLQPLEEPYVLHQSGLMLGYDTQDKYPMQVEEGYLFVMGDNRNGSLDSRDELIGQIDKHYVIGRAVFRLFPFQSFGKID